MTEILNLIGRYFDLLQTCDVSGFDRVFHPAATLQTVGPSGHVLLSSDQYKDILRKRASSPPSNGTTGNGRILFVDSASPTTALAKVTATINGADYIDYLSLIRADDEWLIAAKTYSIVPGQGS